MTARMFTRLIFLKAPMLQVSYRIGSDTSTGTLNVWTRPREGGMTKWWLVIIGLVSVCALTAARGQAAPDPMVSRGRALAIKVCYACHIVSEDQPFAPILRQPAPEFRTIANRPGTTAESLRDFLSTTHVTISAPFAMPSPELTDQMTDQIISYIMSLRRQP
jgi:cytochrome c